MFNILFLFSLKVVESVEGPIRVDIDVLCFGLLMKLLKVVESVEEARRVDTDVLCFGFCIIHF